jgi:hypothetical protein
VTRRLANYGRLAVWAVSACLIQPSWALDPHKTLTQYSRHVWGQQDGLPQDTVKSITQTPDGYLWLGTDEGLARFDGFEFTVFSRPTSDLPANSITAWRRRPTDRCGSVRPTDWASTAIVASAPSPSRTAFRTTTFATCIPIMPGPCGCFGRRRMPLPGWQVHYVLKAGVNLPMTSARVVREDRQHNLLVAGSNLPDSPALLRFG